MARFNWDKEVENGIQAFADIVADDNNRPRSPRPQVAPGGGTRPALHPTYACNPSQRHNTPGGPYAPAQARPSCPDLTWCQWGGGGCGHRFDPLDVTLGIRPHLRTVHGVLFDDDHGGVVVCCWGSCDRVYETSRGLLRHVHMHHIQGNK